MADKKITELSSVSTLPDGAVFTAVDSTRSAGDQNVQISKADLAADIGGELEYQAEITTSTTLTTQEGLNKVYPVNSASDVVITVPQGVYSENDVINFERRGDGSVEFVGANDNVRLRGVRDVENRYFINNKFSWVSLVCRGSNEWSVVGRLKDGYTGAVTTSNYSILTPDPSAQNVTVTGTGFSDNMLVTLTGNATLNSFVVNNSNEVVLNITPSGSLGDKLTIEYDNGDVFTDIDAITISLAKLFDQYPFEFGWALWQMNTTNTYATNVRRSSDNATTDVGFNSAGKVALDSPVSAGGDLSTWAGSDDVFVVTRYNQGSLGASFDLTQSDTTKQAKLLNAGALIVQDTRTFIEFDGTDDFYDTTGTDNWASGELSVFADIRHKTQSDGCLFGNFTSSATTDRMMYMRFNSVNAAIQTLTVNDNGVGFAASETAVQSLDTNINAVTITDSANSTTYADGVAGTPVTRATLPTETRSINHGGLEDYPSFTIDGYNNYLIMYKSDKASDLTAIQNLIDANL